MNSAELREWASEHCICDDVPTTEMFEERDITVTYTTTDNKQHTVTLLNHECTFYVECNKFGEPLCEEISEADVNAYFEECLCKNSRFHQEIVDKLLETQAMFQVNEELNIASINEVREATCFESECAWVQVSKESLMFTIGNMQYDKVADKVFRFKSRDKWLEAKEKFSTLNETVKTILRIMTGFNYNEFVISEITDEVEKILNNYIK